MRGFAIFVILWIALVLIWTLDKNKKLIREDYLNIKNPDTIHYSEADKVSEFDFYDPVPINSCESDYDSIMNTPIAVLDGETLSFGKPAKKKYDLYTKRLKVTGEITVCDNVHWTGGSPLCTLFCYLKAETLIIVNDTIQDRRIKK